MAIKKLLNFPSTKEWEEMLKKISSMDSSGSLVETNTMALGEEPMPLGEEPMAVYKKIDENTLQFYDFFDRQRKYDDEFYVLPVGSVFSGVETWDSGKKFANVIGSTQDYKICGLSWLTLYEIVIKILQDPRYKVRGCCTDGKYYVSPSYTSYGCNGTIIGGHVLPGDTADSRNPGQFVYLLPICARHNTAGTHGTGYYMQLASQTYAVRLYYYVTLNTQTENENM